MTLRQVTSATYDAHVEDSLERLNAEVVGCRSCPRLVAWREQVGSEKRLAFADAEYWARPITGFGDSAARLLIVGLAPAAHGGNRTGRVFTGDRSGDWLFGALHRAGYANQPTSRSLDDGLTLDGAYVSACRSLRPAAEQADARRAGYVLALSRARAAAATARSGGRVLGEIRLRRCRPPRRTAAAAGVRARRRGGAADGRQLVCSFHPSQQNTFTRKLTVPMFDAIFARARENWREKPRGRGRAARACRHHGAARRGSLSGRELSRRGDARRASPRSRSK